jgi:GDP-L-fucose synthase
LRKFHDAAQSRREEIVVRGTGTPRREFLHVDNLADAVIFVMRNYSDETLVNVGTGTGVTIKELAEAIAETTGFKGALCFDTTKPDGTQAQIA